MTAGSEFHEPATRQHEPATRQHEPATRQPDGSDQSIFSPRYRITTLGILILMTIIAFEALAVATALPTAARSLHGLAAYGWAAWCCSWPVC